MGLIKPLTSEPGKDTKLFDRSIGGN